MECKYCNAQIGDDHLFCPYCGKPLVENEDVIVDDQETFEEVLETPAKKISGWKLGLAIAGAIVALAALAVLLLYAFGVKLTPRANDIHKKDAYVVSEQKAVEKADVVVAVINGKELTNTQLQVFYRLNIQEFLSYYGSYLSMLGLDTTKPLNEQPCYFDQALTWEQYFLSSALDAWYDYQCLVLLADEAGFTLSDDIQAELDKIPEQMQADATKGEYESIDAYVQDVLGPCCDLQDYIDYIQLVTLGGEYYAAEYERLIPTDADVEAFYAENLAAYEAKGIKKDSGLVSSVRHILICPEGEEDADGKVTYSDEDWDNCLKKAQSVLDEWKAGAATEESFVAMVPTYTEDEGSASTGGLYENIAPGASYVEDFLSWSIDMSRQKGDVDIVKSEYGYHIMYFVKGEAYWFNTAKSDLLVQRTTALIDGAQAKWPMEVNYSKIAIVEPEF